jgi:predicted transcriptional regulator
MKTNILLPPKNKKETMSLRLPDDLRKKVEKLAADNNTTLTNVVESGLVLLFEKLKNESSKS